MADSVKPPSCDHDHQVIFGAKPILFVQQVAQRLCCHHTTVYRMADSGVIPKPINIGAKKKFAWFEDDINRYVLTRLAQSSTDLSALEGV